MEGMCLMQIVLTVCWMFGFTVCYRLFKWLGFSLLWGIQVLHRRQGEGGRGTFGYSFTATTLYFTVISSLVIGKFKISHFCHWMKCLCSIYPTF